MSDNISNEQDDRGRNLIKLPENINEQIELTLAHLDEEYPPEVVEKMTEAAILKYGDGGFQKDSNPL